MELLGEELKKIIERTMLKINVHFSQKCRPRNNKMIIMFGNGCNTIKIFSIKSQKYKKIQVK